MRISQSVFELGARMSSFALIVGQQFLEFTRPLVREYGQRVSFEEE